MLIAYKLVEVQATEGAEGSIDGGAILGIVFLVLFVFALTAYYELGCCGGGGARRNRTALTPIAVRVENEAILRGRNVDEATLRKVAQPWFETIFFPILMAEDLVFLILLCIHQRLPTTERAFSHTLSIMSLSTMLSSTLT